MNPCPCGRLGDESGRATAAEQVSRYRSRISGPPLDCIDLQVAVSRPHSFLSEYFGLKPENSEQVRAHVIAARDIQQERSGGTNAQLNPAGIAGVSNSLSEDVLFDQTHAHGPRAAG